MIFIGTVSNNVEILFLHCENTFFLETCSVALNHSYPEPCAGQ
jgi:hypothetical protein